MKQEEVCTVGLMEDYEELLVTDMVWHFTA